MPKNDPMIYIALAADGRVIAHFADFEYANAFCNSHDFTFLPYNLDNRDKAAAPLVGTIYRA